MEPSTLLRRTHQRLAAMELAELRREAQALRERLAADTTRVEARLREIAGDADDDASTVDDALDDYRSGTDYLPNQHRLALFTMAYGTLERRVHAIASAFLALKGSALELADFAGNSPLGRSRRCLHKLAKLDLPGEAWNVLDPYRGLRNAAVQEGGRFPKAPPKALRQFAAEAAALSAEPESGVVIGDAFIDEFLGRVETFYGQLFDAWERWE